MTLVIILVKQNVGTGKAGRREDGVWWAMLEVVVEVDIGIVMIGRFMFIDTREEEDERTGTTMAQLDISWDLQIGRMNGWMDGDWGWMGVTDEHEKENRDSIPKMRGFQRTT